MIQFLLLFAAAVSLVLAAVVLVFLTVGIVLFFIPKLRTVAPFVLFIPTLGSFVSLGSSWGLSYLVGKLSDSADSVDAWEFWQVLSLWAWPAGLFIGGLVGIVLGFLIAWVIRKRQLSHRKKSESSR